MLKPDASNKLKIALMKSEHQKVEYEKKEAHLREDMQMSERFYVGKWHEDDSQKRASIKIRS